MKVVMFYHSLVSDWNHGNAHFLRGIASELLAQGHEVEVYEPSDSWSRTNLIEKFGTDPIRRFEDAYPELESHIYDAAHFYPEAAVRGADLVIVHEWNTPELVSQMGRLRLKHPFVLLFHDTHHRMATKPDEMKKYDLSAYDGVLAYGQVLRDLYLSRNFVRRAWVWHEAADIRRFHPKAGVPKDGDLVWIGNWGDEERSAELHEFLIEPVRALGLKAAVYGVRYPGSARAELARAGIEYKGWLPNFNVPDIFSRFHLTIHVPRRPYVEALPGIPTIRPFESLACGIPLISAPWPDVEHLFAPGEDLVFVRDGAEMEHQLHRLMADDAARQALSNHGLHTILAKHTCAHRVSELMTIYQEVRAEEFVHETTLTFSEP
jgi:spore maturation protein CgeB